MTASHDDIIKTTLGQRISSARMARGLSVAQLARRISVRTSTLQSWEQDRSEPRASKMQILAGVLTVPVVWLMAGESIEQDLTSNFNITETASLVNKLDQLHQLHQQSATLIFELMSEIRRLQREIDEA